MSAIGDYIHLHASNYLNYGISKTGGEKKPSLEEVYIHQRTANKMKIDALPVSNNEIEELKTRIEKAFPEGKDDAKLQKAINTAEGKYADQFKNFLLNKIPNAAKEIGLKNIENITFNNQNVDIDQVKTKRNQLLDNIKYLNGEKGSKEKLSTINTINNNLKDYFNAIGAALPKDFNFNIGKNIDCVTALKAVISGNAFSNANRASLQGAWGERAVAMCSDIVKGLAGKELEEALKKTIVGSETSSFNLKTTMFTPSVAQHFEEQKGNNLFQVHTSQNKVDVKVEINNKPLNVSVKSYTGKNNKLFMHLQYVDLLSSLATTVTDFANHWLNIHSLAGLGYMKGQSALNGIDKELTEHIKFQALVSGNALKQGNAYADTFVAIDVSTGKILAVSTKELLMGTSNTKFYINPFIENIYLSSNKSANSSAERIANIISEVRRIKIKVSLSADLN